MDAEILKAIELYTQTHRAMPTKIRGTFAQLIPLSWLNGYTKVMGKDVYVVPLGALDLELDTDATDWYLA